MNIRLLKKIRKRYRYHWDDILWVLDLKKQEVRIFKGVDSFLLDYVYNNLGLWTGFKYQERLLKREKRSQFRQHLKQFIHQSPQTKEA
jgi:hypothetical protein